MISAQYTVVKMEESLLIIFCSDYKINQKLFGIKCMIFSQ